MVLIVRILPEVEKEQEVNAENEQRRHESSHPGKNGRKDYSAQRNVVSRGHTLSIGCIERINSKHEGKASE